jgi:integrase
VGNVNRWFVFVLDEHRKAWFDRIYRPSHSDNSRHVAEMALRAFDRVLGEPAEIFIGKVKQGKAEPYSVFDGFMAELDKAGLSPNSIRGYVNRVKQYFAYNDVSLDKDVFRIKVGLPRVEEPDEGAPTVEDLRKILSWGKLRTKVLVLVLTSSGVRLGEVIKLKVGDIDFGSRPVRVTLSPKAASKTGERRTIYISDEATELLKQYLGNRITDAESWVFISEAGSTKHMSEDKAWRTVIDCVEKAGLGKSKETTMHERRKIHLHSFRKFFFSRVVGVIGETAAHALMGHGSYMKTYYKRTEEERARDYLRCMPYLTVLGESPDKDRWKQEAKLEAIRAFAQALDIDPIHVRIEKQKELRRELTAEEEIGAIQNEIKKMRIGNDDSKKIIVEKDLPEHLAEGWEIQNVLPSGKIVIRK